MTEPRTVREIDHAAEAAGILACASVTRPDGLAADGGEQGDLLLALTHATLDIGQQLRRFVDLAEQQLGEDR